MGAPLAISFGDGTERCTRCKGLGLVRGEYPGSKPGRHYRSLSGAQAALDAGRAVDCDACDATGIVDTRAAMMAAAQ